MSVGGRSLMVGVHGVAQQQLGRKQLLRDWAPALADGLALAFGQPVADPPLDLAFYGNVFLPRSGAATKGIESLTTDESLAELSEAEMADLLDVAREAVTLEEI